MNTEKETLITLMQETLMEQMVKQTDTDNITALYQEFCIDNQEPNDDYEYLFFYTLPQYL